IVVLGRGVGLATMGPISQLAGENGVKVTAILSARSRDFALGADLFAKVGDVIPVLDSDGTSAVENVEAILNRLIAEKRADAFYTELAQAMDINRLGALVTKTVSREFRIGNPPPRVAELEGGMINSIGLPGKGLGYFLEHQLPEYKRFTPPIVANITATTADDFAAMARDVSLPEIESIEM